jgi:hypothetical protein
MNTSGLHMRHDGEEPKAPARLVAALKESAPRRVFVPPTVDDAVLASARRQLAKPQRTGYGALRSWLLWPATATACLVLAGVGFFLLRQPGSSRFAAEDINHDGRVDILDAFALARAVQAGVKPMRGPDLNGDGVVDQRDVAWIAAQAVKLEKGGRS